MSKKIKSSSEVEVDRIVEKKEVKKAPVKQAMKVGDISKCGQWEVKTIGKEVDLIPSKINKSAFGVATKTVADAEAMMV
jgi:hypothetical protein